jgi:hypothetical protein
MRFVDFLKATVLLSAGAATTLGVLTIAAEANTDDNKIVLYAVGWWVVATIIGGWVGRRNQVNPPIGRLLADAHNATMMPELKPGSVLLNRLWPLIVCVVAAGVLAFVAPQIPGIATGFCIIWALAWRRQESAVRAIEERDGVTFFVEPTSPFRPMQLTRMPGFRREVPSIDGAGTNAP